MTDWSLEQAVRNALYHEPYINLDRIVVTVHGGVARLAGEVDTDTQRLAVRYKAQCVSGVSEVLDELGVRVPARVERYVEDIEIGVMNALFWDVAVPRDRVSASCNNGWVTLSGEVELPYQKSCAEADARKVRGVIGVTNAIKVATGMERVNEMAPGAGTPAWRAPERTAH